MSDELATATTEEEKQAIVEKYSDKIFSVTGGKVEVTKPSGSSGGNSLGNTSGSSSSGNTSSGTGSDGGSSPGTSTGSGSSGGNSGGNSGSGSDSGSSSGSGDTPHKHTVTVGDLGWEQAQKYGLEVRFEFEDEFPETRNDPLSVEKV